MASDTTLRDMPARLSPEDRRLYDAYDSPPRRFDSDSLLRLADQAQDPGLRKYFEDASWDEFRREERRYFDSDY